MNVVVEEGLQDLREALESRGYTIVSLGGNQPVDAIIYQHKGNSGVSPYQEESQSRAFMGENIHTEHGAFMVNAKDKSVDEIDQLLQQRTYTPLLGDFY